MNGTSCKNCGAATYGPDCKTQIGCAFDRLEVLKVNGVKVIPAYDEEKEFFVLDKTCYYYRSTEWASRYSHGGLLLNFVDSLKLAVEAENTLVYNAILWENSEIDIDYAIDKLMVQKNKPKHITVLLRYNTLYSISHLREQLDTTKIPWTLSEKVGIETDDIYHGVKDTITKHSAPFFLLVFSHKDITDNLLQSIERDMLDKGLSFNYVLCPKKSILVPYKILEYYITAERGNFINKILEDECLTSYNT